MMITSNEQIRLSAACLHSQGIALSHGEGSVTDVPADLMSRIMEYLSSVPDVRDDRVTHARDLMTYDPPSASAIAEKLLGRVICDSLQ